MMNALLILHETMRRQSSVNWRLLQIIDMLERCTRVTYLCAGVPKTIRNEDISLLRRNCREVTVVEDPKEEDILFSDGFYAGHGDKGQLLASLAAYKEQMVAKIRGGTPYIGIGSSALATDGTPGHFGLVNYVIRRYEFVDEVLPVNSNKIRWLNDDNVSVSDMTVEHPEHDSMHVALDDLLRREPGRGDSPLFALDKESVVLIKKSRHQHDGSVGGGWLFPQPRNGEGTYIDLLSLMRTGQNTVLDDYVSRT